MHIRGDLPFVSILVQGLCSRVDWLEDFGGDLATQFLDFELIEAVLLVFLLDLLGYVGELGLQRFYRFLLPLDLLFELLFFH